MAKLRDTRRGLRFLWHAWFGHKLKENFSFSGSASSGFFTGQSVWVASRRSCSCGVQQDVLRRQKWLVAKEGVIVDVLDYPPFEIELETT